MMVEKNRPGLFWRTRRTHQSHVFLNRRSSDFNVQFEEFPMNAFSAPKRILLGHLLDQAEGVDRQLGTTARGTGFEFPEEAKPLSMPAP